MSIQVKVINVLDVKRLLKECPKEVREYVNSLEWINKSQRDLINKSISEIRKLSK